MVFSLQYGIHTEICTNALKVGAFCTDNAGVLLPKTHIGCDMKYIARSSLFALVLHAAPKLAQQDIEQVEKYNITRFGYV